MKAEGVMNSVRLTSVSSEFLTWSSETRTEVNSHKEMNDL